MKVNLKSLNQAIEEHIKKFGKATYIGSETILQKAHSLGLSISSYVRMLALKEGSHVKNL